MRFGRRRRRRGRKAKRRRVLQPSPGLRLRPPAHGSGPPCHVVQTRRCRAVQADHPELFQDLFSTNEDEGEEPFNVGLQAIPTNSLDFSGDPFQLQSLEYLNIIGLGKPELREKLTEFHLARNQLTSLTRSLMMCIARCPTCSPRLKN